MTAMTASTRFQVLLLLLLFPLVSAAQEEQRFLVRPDQSRFSVEVGRAGLLKVFGHDHLIEVRRYTGEVVWRPKAKETSSVRLEIEAASLTVVGEDVSEKDRATIQRDMESKVLEVEKYPAIRFESRVVNLGSGEGPDYRGTLAGELTLHGVTKPVQIPVQVTVTGERLRAWGEVKLKGSDFGIQPVSVAGGAVKTKDEIGLKFDLVATP